MDSDHLTEIGRLYFEFKGDPKILQVHVYSTSSFTGNPTESEEVCAKQVADGDERGRLWIYSKPRDRLALCILSQNLSHTPPSPSHIRFANKMAPEWFDEEKIPFQTMWPDDKYWFDRMLAGRRSRESCCSSWGRSNLTPIHSNLLGFQTNPSQGTFSLRDTTLFSAIHSGTG